MDASDEAAEPRSGWLFAAVAFQLAVALTIGGTARPLNVLVCFLASLPTLALLLLGLRQRRPHWTALVALTLYAFAWLQLVPLPPQVWTAMPGRDLALQVLEMAGLPPGWRPLALDPGAAATALASIAAPLVLLVAAARLHGEEHLVLLRGIVALALLTAILGLFQRVTGGLTLYDIEHAGTATGLFANRNHQAAFLACALVLLPALRRNADDNRAALLCLAASAVLFTGILATTSRAGIVLGAGALAVSQALWWRVSPRSIAFGGVVLAGLGFALLQVPALAPVFDRFADLADDQRLTMAETGWTAARAYFPWGAGWGSFVPVYMAFEDLDSLFDRYVVAAHNDYLQLMLEGGLFGIVVALAAPLGLLAVAAFLWRSKAPPHHWAMVWVAAVLLLHSAVDFPLRTDALAALLALSFAMQDNRAKPLPVRPRAD